MSNQRRLGRGLQALLGTFGEEGEGQPPEGEPHQNGHPPQHDEHAHHDQPPASDEHQQPQAESNDSDAPPPEGGVILLGVDEIYDNPFQPRREFSDSEIASLSESLKEHDMLQPMLVRPTANGGYQLIAGERRLRAARQAGWTHVPCQVKHADDRLVAELAIVENLQRQDLNAVEKAMSFQRYIEQHGCTQEDLAKRIKVDRATIANMMRLLELPETVKQSLIEKKITAGHARALLPLGEEQLQLEFNDKIQAEGLSVRAVEQLVRDRIDSEDREVLSVVHADGTTSPAPAKPQDANLADLEQQLRTALGTKVEVRKSGKKKGRIVIHFQSPEEFQRLRGVLTGSEGQSSELNAG